MAGPNGGDSTPRRTLFCAVTGAERVATEPTLIHPDKFPFGSFGKEKCEKDPRIR